MTQPSATDPAGIVALRPALLAGDAAAIDAWYRAEHPGVWRLCLGVLADATEADDLAQDAMLHLLDTLDRWDPARPWPAWRNRVVVNLCRDRLRRRATRAGHEDAAQRAGALLPAALPSPEDAAHAGEVHEQLGAPAGFVGPVKVSGVTRIVADESLRQGSYVAGANREGYHLTGVVAGRDFQCEWADLQAVLPGEACPSCGAALRVERVIEVGNIFKLGTKYSVPFGAVYLDEQGRERPIVMGSYGIGPARIAAAAVEQRHDADGIVWPWNIAPFQVHLIPVASREAVQAAAAEDIYRALVAAGFEVLLDDRDERAGVKFKDADLLGVPIRVTVGQGFVREGLVEIRERATRRERKVPRAEVLATLRTVAGELAGG